VRCERRENVAQVHRVLGVAVEVRPRSQARRRHAVDHGPIAQNRKVKAVAVEGHELRAQLGDFIAERPYQLLLAALSQVRRAQRVQCPAVALAVSNERADAHDGVVDVLGEPVAELGANIRVWLADEAVGGCEPGQIGHCLQVPHDDAWFHAGRSVTHLAGLF
jgi:hypothetical protein